MIMYSDALDHDSMLQSGDRDATEPTTRPFGLLELGSNSLKFYRLEFRSTKDFKVTTRKWKWKVSHDYYSSGVLDEVSTRAVVAAIQRVVTDSRDIAPHEIICLATGVFRDIRSIRRLTARIATETGVRTRVITGKDEARLMAKSFKSTRLGDIFLCDLGGSTTEWATMSDGRRMACGSLPLGAIRNLYALTGSSGDPDYLRKCATCCDRALRTIAETRSFHVMATGGTAKALAMCQGEVVSLVELRKFIRTVHVDGPPQTLKPKRRDVFLPGLVILERIATRCRSSSIEYAKNSLRDGLIERLLSLVKRNPRRDIRATLLLHTHEFSSAERRRDQARDVGGRENR